MTKPHKFCHCELTGYVELLIEGKGCELCEGGEEITTERIQAAFTWYKKELDKLITEKKNG